MALTQVELKQLVTYDPATGQFFARGRPVKTSRRGGNSRLGFYTGIRLCGEDYYAHRLAWLYMTGEWPAHQVDHRDGDRSNNRWDNLRAATPLQNNMNSKVRKHNTTGLKGVCFHKKSGLYGARIRLDGYQRSLGYYDCPAAAHFAYVKAADKLFGEYARFA